MISRTQASEYLDKTLGISVPSFVVAAAVERVESAEAAMIAAGYTEPVQVLIQCMAVALVAAPASARRIKDQRAPSGASRGFDNAKDPLSVLRRQLAALDTAGTVTDIVGPDPAAATLFLVAA